MKINTINIQQIKSVNGGFCLCGRFNSRVATNTTKSETQEDCYKDCCPQYDKYQYSSNNEPYRYPAQVHACDPETEQREAFTGIDFIYPQFNQTGSSFSKSIKSFK